MRRQADESSGTVSRLERWEWCTEWPLTILAVLFLAGYSVQVLAPSPAASKHGIDLLLNVVWFLFALDYVARLALAKPRWTWATHHLLDLAAVALPVLRPLRLLRLITLLRVLERHAGTALRGRITLYTAVSVALLVYISALAVLDAERFAEGATITNFQDALWWAIVTITTVGYGDFYPVTLTGRTIAVLLMIGGVALIGVVTATLASWVVSLVAEETAEQQAATRAQVTALQKQVDHLTSRIEELLEERWTKG